MSHQEMRRLETKLAKVRGLGSAKNGTEHWWAQRVTAVTLAFLGVWFVWSILGIGHDFDALRAWLARPFNASLMVLFVISLVHHGQLGLQVVIEDYVHHEFMKLSLIFAVKFFAFLLGIAGILAVASISFGKAAT